MKREKRLPHPVAVHLLADQNMKPHDTKESAYKRVSLQINRHIKKGLLKRQPDGTILESDLMAWAVGKFKSHPAPDRATAMLPALTVNAVCIEVPGSFDEAKKMCTDLQMELIKAHGEIAKLQPEADRRRKKSESAVKAWDKKKRSKR